MSSGKKQQKKRKRQSPLPFKSPVALRLEKLRGGRRDLWEDDDDDDAQSKPTQPTNVYIVLSDSEEERPSSSRRQLRSHKSKKNISRNHNESVSSDNNVNATCLICSVLSRLSSNNCCSKHLSALKKHRHRQQQSTTNNSQWLPQQVMIVPVTDEIVQRYLDPQQLQRLRTHTSTSPTNKITSERNIVTRKSLNKSTMTLNHSEVEQPIKNIQKSSQVNDIRPRTSPIVIESARSNSATVPPDTISTSRINNVENRTILDANLLHESFTQTIIIDDSETDNPEGNILFKTNMDYKQIDPWIPISDDIHAALEIVLNQIDSSSDTPTEYTPITARRTDTAIMAARLPKLQLKGGRFRSGKPIIDRTKTNAANEYRPSSSTSSITFTSIRSSPPVTNVEDQSSIKPSSNQTDTHNVNVTNDLFTQDVAIPHDDISRTIRPNEAPCSIMSENTHEQIEIHRSTGQNGTQHFIPSTTRDRTTPVRISFRFNPDGSRVSLSRPPLPTDRRSPLIHSLRRTSMDVSPIIPNTKQM